MATENINAKGEIAGKSGPTEEMIKLSAGGTIPYHLVPYLTHRRSREGARSGEGRHPEKEDLFDDSFSGKKQITLTDAGEENYEVKGKNRCLNCQE